MLLSAKRAYDALHVTDWLNAYVESATGWKTCWIATPGANVPRSANSNAVWLESFTLMRTSSAMTFERFSNVTQTAAPDFELEKEHDRTATGEVAATEGEGEATCIPTARSINIIVNYDLREAFEEHVSTHRMKTSAT